MSQLSPFFSIIIPSYNRAYILPKCIESINKQIFSDYEIVIVDDGSKDNTKEVVTQLNNPKINYIYQTNAERSAARNNGIKQAKGQFICFLDSDDFYLENHLQVLHDKIVALNYKVAMYFTDCKILQNNQITVPPSHDITSDLYSYFLNHSIVPGRVCIHKSIFNDFVFDVHTSMGEDTVLWCNIVTKYPVVHLKENTFLYHLHDDNTVMLEKNCFLPRLIGLRRMFENPVLMKAIPRQSRLEVISSCYFGIARHYELVKKFWPMFYNILLSIAYTPFKPTTKKKIYMIYAYVFGKPSNNY